MTSGTRVPTAVQGIIAFSLGAGVLLFGAIIYFMQRQGTWTAMAPGRAEPMRIAAMLACLLGAAALYLLRRRTSTRTEMARYAHINLVAWAVGEATALLGGVYFFLSGDPTWYILGAVIFAASVLLFPVRRG